MIRRAVVAVLVLLAVLAGAAGSAHAGLADRIGATFGLMEQDFIRAFAPTEGLVVSLDQDEIFISVDSEHGAQIGQEYTVFRKGAVFRHPLTGKPLGHFEDVLGWAQLKRVYPKFAVGTFVPKPDTATPQPGDGVRITRGRIRVAVAPVLDLTDSGADVRRVPFLIASALDRSKRFQVVDPLTVTDVFARGAVRVEQMLLRPAAAVSAAKTLDVVGWIVPVVLERRGVTYLDATYISAITGTALFSRRQALVPTAAAEEQRFPWEPRGED